MPCRCGWPTDTPILAHCYGQWHAITTVVELWNQLPSRKHRGMQPVSLVSQLKANIASLMLRRKRRGI